MSTKRPDSETTRDGEKVSDSGKRQPKEVDPKSQKVQSGRRVKDPTTGYPDPFGG